MIWTTKEGQKIKVSKMDDNHLINAYKMVNRKAEKGVCVVVGGDYWSDGGDVWYDEFYIYGDEVKKRFPYKEMTKEIEKRNLKL